MQSVEFLAIGSFRKFQIFFISQNPDFFSFRKIQFFFSFHKIQIYRLATSFSDSEIVPCTGMHALFIIRALHHIICLPLFNIYNWFISQNPDFFTDLQQTVCGCNWFISQNPDIFFSFRKILIL